MNGKLLHMPVSDDRQAMRRVLWDLARRHSWAFLVLAVCGICLKIRAKRDDDVSFQLMAAFMLVDLVRSELSSQTLRMLPLSRQNLARTIWRLLIGYPLAIMAVLCVAQEICRGFTGEAWYEAWDRALYSFSSFLIFDGIFVAGSVAGRSSSVKERALAGRKARDERVVMGILVISLLFAWISLVDGFLEKPHAWVMAINLLVGGAATAILYGFRDRLLIQFPKPAVAEARHREFGLVWITQRLESWRVALLKHMSSSMAWSACVAGLTIVVWSMVVVSGDSVFPVDSLIGVVVGASVLSLCGGWFGWSSELRVWRMLPLGHLRCGGAIVVFIAAASILPWTLAFVCIGLLQVFWGSFGADALFSLLGMSLMAQGVLLPIFPSILRGIDEELRRVLLTVVMFAGVGSILFSKPLSAQLQGLLQIGPVAHGWAWMGAGALVLCAGMAVSAWHAERVLRHGDCYGRATE